MGLNTIRQTIEQTFYDNWTDTNVDTHVRYSNAPFTPPKEANWASIDVRWLPAINASINSSAPCVRRRGILIIDLYSPIDDGMQVITAMGDNALTLFENQQLSVTADAIGTAIQFLTSDIRHVGVPNIQGTDPMWYKLSIRLIFHRDE